MRYRVKACYTHQEVRLHQREDGEPREVEASDDYGGCFDDSSREIGE